MSYGVVAELRSDEAAEARRCCGAGWSGAEPLVKDVSRHS